MGILPRLALALFVAVGVQATFGTAAQAAGELRALACCAHDCGHANVPMDPARCCGVAPSPTDTGGVTPRATSVATPVLALVAVALGAPALPTAATTAAPAGVARGTPAFLLQHSLRL